MSKSTTDLRLEIEAWRTRRRTIAQYKRRIRLIEDAISLFEEEAANQEFDVAIGLLETGPVDSGGRRFQFELRDGCPSVRVDPVKSTERGAACLA